MIGGVPKGLQLCVDIRREPVGEMYGLEGAVEHGALDDANRPDDGDE